MAEKTSVWKGVRRQVRENTFLEFDYLSVLDNHNNRTRKSALRGTYTPGWCPFISINIF